MREPHWVHILLFLILVCALLGMQVATFIWCMESHRRRQLAGWFAGLVLGLLLLANSADSFAPMPLGSHGIDWGDIIIDTIAVSWWFVLGGLVFSAGILTIEERVRVPAKVGALLILMVNAFATYALVHLYIIREWNGSIFSWFVGSLLGWTVHRAFLRDTPERQPHPA